VKTRHRVAVLADVHGNVDALGAVLAELRTEPPDLIVVAGDVTWGPFPRETLDALSRVLVPVQWVRGNAERAFDRAVAGRRLINPGSVGPPAPELVVADAERRHFSD
jgi:predicted phosphodiesterase